MVARGACHGSSLEDTMSRLRPGWMRRIQVDTNCREENGTLQHLDWKGAWCVKDGDVGSEE